MQVAVDDANTLAQVHLKGFFRAEFLGLPAPGVQEFKVQGLVRLQGLRFGCGIEALRV